MATEILRLSDDRGKAFLRGLLLTGRCVPFIGAGFTAGERSHGGTVPDGTEFAEVMRKAIASAAVSEKPSDEALEKYSFQELADEYFREPIVPEENIKQTLRASFTEVSIASEAKRSFLSWDWAYFYTLNIDDAIERTIGAIKVLPFTAFQQPRATQFVYKLHGDAADAITAASREKFKVVFGSADYISSLITNRPFLSTLANDLVERHILFVGCSLTDEIDILYSLAGLHASDDISSSTSRVLVTSREPVDYESKKKLRRYGITHVLIVDYPEFYAFVGATERPIAFGKSPLQTYEFADAQSDKENTDGQLKYLLQVGWKSHEDPRAFAVPRGRLVEASKRIDLPIVVVWGRRFSGRTTMLFQILRKHQNRRRFFVPSSASASEAIINGILRLKDGLVAVDTDALSYQQIQLLSRKTEQLADNNTTVVIATNRAWLSALGSSVSDAAVELDDRMWQSEADAINALLAPFGLSATWRPSLRNLDNIFALSESNVVRSLLREKSRLLENIDRLQRQWSSGDLGRLEFGVLFYLGTRQRIYSRFFRELVLDAGLAHMAGTHFDDFASAWGPFLEVEDAEPPSMLAERSTRLIVANASAWIHFSVRRLASKLGAAESAAQIVRVFKVMEKLEEKAFELLLFDNLNAMFTEDLGDLRSKLIREVYERLAETLSGEPDYWLQRAKSLYYLSNAVEDLRVGVEYCDKSIVQRASKTSTNAKLTKANLLGKVCKVLKSPEDADLEEAIDAYVEAIDSRSENPVYIDELLRRSRSGKSYMSLVCRLALKRATLLPKRHDIDHILAYVKGGG